MTANEQKRHGDEDIQIAALREAIGHAFPPSPYKGKITPCDDQWVNPELDDEKILYDALRGRQWTELSRELLFSQLDGYVLLTNEAFASFLPAWLMCSLDNIEGENEVRNYIVYAFSNTAQQLRNLTPQQTGGPFSLS